MHLNKSSLHFDLARIRSQTNVDLVYWEPSMASTNLCARENADRQWSDQRTVLVLTDEQTAGRGRGSNHWWSSDGALTMSLLHRAFVMPLPGDLVSRMSLTVGAAVCRALESLQNAADMAAIGLKWPNDIWLGDRKLGGILIEAPADGDALILGLGLNINNSFRQAPPPLRHSAVSTLDGWGRKLDLSDVVVAVVREVELQWNSLAQAETPAAELWQSRSVLDGRNVRFRIGDRTLLARCEGIDEFGALLLKTERGTERFLAGTIDDIF